MATASGRAHTPAGPPPPRSQASGLGTRTLRGSPRESVPSAASLPARGRSASHPPRAERVSEVLAEEASPGGDGSTRPARGSRPARAGRVPPRLPLPSDRRRGTIPSRCPLRPIRSRHPRPTGPPGSCFVPRSRSGSVTAVPGLKTSTTRRATNPFASAGFSTCSQIATRSPACRSFWMCGSALCHGKPARGIGSGVACIARGQSDSEDSLESVTASSKKVS